MYASFTGFLRTRSGGDMGVMSLDDFMAQLQEEIDTKKI